MFNLLHSLHRDSGVGFAALQLWALAWVCMGGSLWAPPCQPFHLYIIVLSPVWKLTEEIQWIRSAYAESTVFVISRTKRWVSWTGTEISMWPLGCSVYREFILPVLGEIAVFLDQCISYFCSVLLVTVFSSSAKHRCSCTTNFQRFSCGRYGTYKVLLWCLIWSQGFSVQIDLK